MIQRPYLLCLLLAMSLALATLALPVAAESGVDPIVLLPRDSVGFVRLTGHVLDARLRCDEAGCELEIRQRYVLHNRDRVQGKTLQVELATGALPAGLALLDGEGQPLPLLSTSPPVWELTFGANQIRELRLSYRQSVGREHFVAWQWDMAPLARWGDLDSALLAFHLPWRATDRIILRAEPDNYTFDGQTISWLYEQPSELRPHVLLIYAPPTWQREHKLLASKQHYELALLYEELMQSASDVGLANYDRQGEILAQLQAALQGQPGHLGARQRLADIYRSRGDESPQQRLSYLLLAAHELELALQHGADESTGEALGAIYYEAAELAKRQGELANALAYLKSARVYLTGTADSNDQQVQDVMLRWGLDLARRGQASQALVQLEGTLSPRVDDLLLRYVPPFRAVQTTVSLDEGARRAQYRFQLYPPSTAKARAHLRYITQRLSSIEGPDVLLTLPQDTDLAILAVSVQFSSLDDLAQKSARIAAALDSAEDLSQAIIAAPWTASVKEYEVVDDLFSQRRAYREQISLGGQARLWQTASQYARWQLVELSDTPARDERDKLEQQLAILALHDQLQIWEQIPPGSYWSYEVRQRGHTNRWRVRWGQERVLQVSETLYNWQAIIQACVIAGALLLAILVVRLVVVAIRHRR